jgi:hypothetical protein
VKPSNEGRSGKISRLVEGGFSQSVLGEALRSRLEEFAPDGRPLADHLAEVLLQRALGGDIGAFKVILDRVDGKVVAASLIDPEPTTIQVIYLPDNGRGDGPEADPNLR